MHQLEDWAQESQDEHVGEAALPDARHAAHPVGERRDRGLAKDRPDERTERSCEPRRFADQVVRAVEDVLDVLLCDLGGCQDRSHPGVVGAHLFAMTNPLAEFFTDVARLEPVVHDDRTANRILDGALAEAAAHGLKSLSIEAVARRAGVNRVTVYRRFGDRDALVAALAAREGHRMSMALLAAVAEVEDPEERLVEGFLASLRYARAHPLIVRAAQVEPEALIGAGLADDAALLRIGAVFLAGGIRDAQRARGAHHVDPDQAGETLARLFASFVLLPGGHLDPTSEVLMRDYSRRTLIPMLLVPKAS